MVTSPTFDADKLRASSQQLRDAAALYARHGRAPPAAPAAPLAASKFDAAF